MAEGVTIRCALFGHPVAHSPSPEMHRLFAEQTGCDLCYETIDTRPGDLASALETFAGEDGRGGNITLPLKEEAWVPAPNCRIERGKRLR